MERTLPGVGDHIYCDQNSGTERLASSHQSERGRQVLTEGCTGSAWTIAFFATVLTTACASSAEGVCTASEGSTGSAGTVLYCDCTTFKAPQRYLEASAIRPGEVNRNANAFDICRRILDCNSRNITDYVSAVPTTVTEIPSATSTTETETPEENHSTVRQMPGLTPTIFERGPGIARMLRGTRQMASAFQVRQTPGFGGLWGKFHDGGKIIY